MPTPRKGKNVNCLSFWLQYQSQIPIHFLFNVTATWLCLCFSYPFLCRSSDSTRYGTNKSSGASSGSHRKSVGSAGGGGGGGGNNGGYNSLMQQTVSNQQQQQRSLFAQQQRQQKPNYKYANNSNSTNSSTNPNHNPNQTLAPVHGAASSANTNSTPPPTLQLSTGGSSSSSAGNAGSGNRLLSYTTFENNQYKFSLNNALAKGSAGAGVASGSSSSNNLTGGGNAVSATGGGNGGAGAGAFSRQRSFVEWPNNPAAPYYYQGPSSSVAQVKRRDAKSDIGVPTRRLSGQSVTKTQLLTGGSSQLANASCYPMHYASSSVTNASFSRALGQRGVGASYNGNGNVGYNGGGGFAGLQPAKSDLFLSYIHGGEYERPYIYNYKMPQMPPGLAGAAGKSSGNGTGSASCSGSGSGSGSGNGSGSGSPKQQQQQQASAYHISGAQTADPPPPPPPLYGGSAPANDVMYYQFDKGAAVMPTQQQPPIVQQPKSAAVAGAGGGAGAGVGASGPLVYLQHGQSVAPSNVTSTQQTVSKPGHVPRQHVA